MNVIINTTRSGLRNTARLSSTSSRREVASPTTSGRPAFTQQRLFNNTKNSRAQYERFGFENAQSAGPSGPSGGGRRPGGNQHPLILALRRRLGDRGIVLYGVGLTGCGVYYVAHLERVAETGRLRFIDTSHEQELAMGLEAQKETLAQFQHELLSPSHRETKRVREIARRIVEGNMLGRMKEGHSLKDLPNISLGSIFGGGDQSGEGVFGGGEDKLNNKDVEWEVYVVNKDVANAFVLRESNKSRKILKSISDRSPRYVISKSCFQYATIRYRNVLRTAGGKIFVFTGILPIAKNDDGLASVMGHEIAHQVARHSAERASSMKVFFVLGYALEALGVDFGIGRILLTYLMQLPNSRQSESEADRIGIRLMAKACYDPRESTRMWERMSEASGGGGMGGIDFTSTHPANSKRIKQLDHWMHEALDIRAASDCGDTASQYEAFKEKVPLGATERVWG